MRMVLLVLLAAAPAVRAGEQDMGRRLWRAQRMEGDIRPGEPSDLALDRAFTAYGEVARKHPRRWEAFEMRGLNRCQKAITVRSQTRSLLNVMRARGAPRSELERVKIHAQQFLERCFRDAIENFAKAELRRRKAGETDREWAVFANAAVKFARGEHLEAKGGLPGSIDDCKQLLRRRYRPELCARMIAEAYNELGALEFGNEKYIEAQLYWDKALRFAQDPKLRRIIITNKAGAFEMDNEFGLAEDILRKQIVKEPRVPKHWKNLGLLLGYQARYREALAAYAKCREYSRRGSTKDLFLGILHGNAWLRAALIHSKLLDEDGDIRKAWRLLLEYRRYFGDNYNLSIAFGEFALHAGEYDAAYAFIRHARNLQPFCTTPYSMLLDVAARTSGKPEEVRARVKEANKAFRAARERFRARLETTTLKRICGGLRDVDDGAAMPGERVMRINPDPLAGFTPERPPPWVEAIAAQRTPYRPYDPALDAPKDRGGADPLPADPAGPGPEQGAGIPTWAWGGAVLLALGALLLFVRRR